MDDQDSLVADLMAPFDRVRPPKPAREDAAAERMPDTPPPPPASARLPDAPPSVPPPAGGPAPGTAGTSGTSPVPPRPSIPNALPAVPTSRPRPAAARATAVPAMPTTAPGVPARPSSPPASVPNTGERGSAASPGAQDRPDTAASALGVRGLGAATASAPGAGNPPAEAAGTAPSAQSRRTAAHTAPAAKDLRTAAPAPDVSDPRTTTTARQLATPATPLDPPSASAGRIQPETGGSSPVPPERTSATPAAPQAPAAPPSRPAVAPPSIPAPRDGDPQGPDGGETEGRSGGAPGVTAAGTGAVRAFAARRTAAARRAVGAVDLTPGPDTGRPFVFLARPALYDDTTTRLRPVGAWVRPRAAAAAACVVLGLGLIGGAATGSWLTGESDAAGGSRNAYVEAGELWHSVPVDELFPPSIKGEGAGPGGADRTWNRVAVAPDSTCKDAFDPLLRKALAPAGCLRLLRATYADATRSHVTTVGLLFTKADAEAMRALRTRFTEEGLDSRPDLMPRPYAAKGTLAAGFGDLQRATWTLSVLPDAPVVAYAVSGFADGRAVTDPEPAAEAMKADATSAPGQAGLGNDAKGIADRVERGLRKTVTAATEKSS
ncbi:hypothetical protein [Streptomyces alboflavus]|uniref:hypothetical protein n=1 Tax=Streptomyces alboflavus TaxID=67267 RepID=UPI0036AD003A